uniref:hypothetical protein n=1 Tax=Amycolatopsis sp. CA-096443 TaxID=3239919 RepID=UPI003F49B39B
MREKLVNDLGETIAILDWKDNGGGREPSEYAKIDDGKLVRRVDGSVLVTLQDRKTGRKTRYEMTDAVIAFYALGLSAHRCNGIDGWLEMTLMPGTAGRD